MLKQLYFNTNKCPTTRTTSNNIKKFDKRKKKFVINISIICSKNNSCLRKILAIEFYYKLQLAKCKQNSYTFTDLFILRIWFFLGNYYKVYARILRNMSEFIYKFSR